MFKVMVMTKKTECIGWIVVESIQQVNKKTYEILGAIKIEEPTKMKYNDEKIKRYEELQASIKAMTKELDSLKDEFIQSNGGESDSYLITLKDNFRESVASKADFEKKFGPSWLKDNGLLKLSAFNTVVISRKIERKVG